MNTNEANDYQHPLQKGLSRGGFEGAENNPAGQTTTDDLEQEVPTLEKIKQLMANGFYRNAIKLSGSVKLQYRHEIIQLTLAKIVSYIKLRMYKAASDELNSIGDFEDKLNLYESYPQHYPTSTSKLHGSMIPFSLRVLKAEIPFLLKTSNSLDALSQLLAICRKEVELLQSQQFKLQDRVTVVPQLGNDAFLPLTVASRSFSSVNATDIDVLFGSFEENLELWRSREVNLSLLIATHLCQEKEYPLAITLIETLLQKYNIPIVYSYLGRIQLQMGNIKAGTASCKQYEQSVPEPEKTVEVHMNRGYIALAVDQFTIAMDHFQAVLDLQPSNVIAANNRAICLLYTCNLTLAVATLEEFISKDPKAHLNETMVFNLCTLYDLKSDNSNDKKKALLSLIGRYAPDNFDFSVIKLTA